MGYVPQEDIVHADLTVQEALGYQAGLRLGRRSPAATREARVEHVLTLMGLLEQRSQLVKTLSGGQRKRVSIACELLNEPQILFLDEPTSGLDPGLDKRMMLLLRLLADQGRTVVLTTHAIAHVDVCDTLVLVGPGGHVIYADDPDSAPSWFGVPTLGDIFSVVDSPEAAAQAAHRASLAQQADGSGPGPAVPPGPVAPGSSARSAPGAPPSGRDGALGGARPPAGSAAWRRAIADQARIFAGRYVRLVGRDRAALAFSLLQGVAVALLTALAVPKPFSWELGGNAPMFVFGCAAVWFGMIGAVRELVKEKTIWHREFLAGGDIAAYLTSKVLVLGALAAFQALTLTVAADLTLGLPAGGPLGHPAETVFLTLWLAILSGMALGLLVSAASASADRAMSLVPYLLITQLVLCGVLFRLGAVTFVSWIMPARWSVSALGGIAGLSAAQLHQTSGLYPHSTAGLLANWLVLLVLAASGLAGTAWLLYRQGRSWSVGSDPAQRPGLSRAAAPGGIDLGGGTFDVTVMDFAGDDLTVRATGGDAYLGGANFDKVLFDHFVEQFETAHGLDINDPEALSLEECTQVSQDWLLRATQVKHDLTARDHTTAALQAAGLTLRVKIRREEFLARARILLDEMTEKMLDVVAAAGVPPQDVSVVLAVGGSTRVPAVRERIQQIFGRSPDTSVRPDEAVALGAALFAAQRQIERGGALLLDPGVHDYLERLTVTDVAAHSLGVSAFAGSGWGERPVMATLLPRNTPLPITVERTFYTLRPGESQIVVPILEDESGDPELCRRVGTVIIDHLPAQRPAQQPVEVSMSLDRDGILQVSAADVTTGAKAHTTVMHAGRTDSGDNAADQAVRTLLVE